MAVCGCGFCSYAIHYHGEPEGTEPVEHVFCTIDNWRTLEAENLPADSIEIEHDDIFSTRGDALVATRLHFSMIVGNISGLTRPKTNFRPSQCRSRLNSDLSGTIFSGLT